MRKHYGLFFCESWKCTHYLGLTHEYIWTEETHILEELTHGQESNVWTIGENNHCEFPNFYAHKLSTTCLLFFFKRVF